MVSFAQCECGTVIYAGFRINLESNQVEYGIPEEQLYGHKGHELVLLKTGKWEMI